jgi:hypothetical protein
VAVAAPFLESAARPLLVVHALLGAAVLGSQTHHAIWSLRDWSRHEWLPRQARLFATVALILTGCQFTVGAILYPSYRVDVRAAVFETVTGPDGLLYGHMIKLFDLKEHAAVACLVVTGLAWLLWRARTDQRLPPRETTAFHRFASVSACLLAWFAAIAGMWVTSAQGLGQVKGGL